MSALKCIIPSVSLKVFGRAIQSLSKIGDELYFEPLEDGLFLRSVNSSRSAYACFQFAPSFFINYVDGNDSGEDNENDGFRCKLGMKSVMSVFRNLSNIEKTVEKCKISLQIREAKLTFQLYCRHGIVKTHNLSYMGCETLQAVFAKDLCPNKLTAEPKLLCDAVLNFQAHQEEVTLIVRPDFVALKNYVEDDTNSSRIIHTELTLVPDEFDHFNVGVDGDITFCLKEFRAVLAFADVTNLPMSLHFEAAGRPVTFAITSDLSFEANFVLATLADDMKDGDDMTSQSKGQKHKKDFRNHTSAKVNQHASNSRKGKNHSRPLPSSVALTDDADDEDMELAQMDIQDITVVENHSHNKHHNHHTTNKHIDKISKVFSSQNSQDVDVNRNSPVLCPVITECNNMPISSRVDPDAASKERLSSSSWSTSQRTMGNECDKTRPSKVSHNNNNNGISGESSTIEMVSVKKPPVKLLSLRGDQSQSQDSSISPEIPLAGTANYIFVLEQSHYHVIVRPTTLFSDRNATNKVGVTSFNDEEEAEGTGDEDTILGTPPSKKFRSLFFGTQTSTQSTQQSQANTTVLAPNSDSDD